MKKGTISLCLGLAVAVAIIAIPVKASAEMDVLCVGTDRIKLWDEPSYEGSLHCVGDGEFLFHIDGMTVLPSPAGPWFDVTIYNMRVSRWCEDCPGYQWVYRAQPAILFNHGERMKFDFVDDYGNRLEWKFELK